MEIHVDKYRVAPEKVFAGTEGSYGMETMEFVFGDEWKHLAKTVTFYPPRTAPVAVVISAEDRIHIPWEVTHRSASVRYVIEGCEEGRVIRTVPAFLIVVPSAKGQGTTGTQPTQDEYQQIYELMQDTLEAVQAVNFELIKVDALPPVGDANKIYVIETGLAPPHKYAEYIYFDGAWEFFGTPENYTGDYDDLSNRPQINGVTLSGNMTLSELGIQPEISDLEAIRAGSALGSTAVQPSDLATVAYTGDYDDLINPLTPSVNDDTLILSK